MTRFSITFPIIVLLLCATSTHAQQKKPKKKEPPRITMIVPIGALPGTKEKFTIRGLGLDKAKEVKFTDAEGKLKIVSKGKAQVRDNNPKQAGDTQVVVELEIPKNVKGLALKFVVVTPDGKSKAHPLLLPNGLPLVKEKERNDGFDSGQKISVPQIIRAEINNQRDVDVYSFEGKKGQRVEIEVFGRRHGSVIDSMITVYDSRGQQVAFNDDANKETTDSKIVLTVPKTGTYHISIIEANDRGGPTYPYWVVVREAKR